MTRKVTFWMGATLDGYVMGPDGSFDWGAPDDELFRAAIEESRRIGVHLMGRRLYETMLYWEDPEQAKGFSDDEREWAALWNPLPKVVFSRTLTEVQGNARLARGSLVEEVEQLRAEAAEGDIAVGGADLAAQAAAAGLIDEYLVRVHPVLVGGGVPFFAPQGRRVDLELLEARTFGSGVVSLRHRVVR